MTALSQSDYNNLCTRRSTILTQLAAMTSSSTGGKPTTNQPGAADHVEYKDGLYRELREIEAMLRMYDEELGGNELGASIISEGVV